MIVGHGEQGQFFIIRTDAVANPFWNQVTDAWFQANRLILVIDPAVTGEHEQKVCSRVNMIGNAASWRKSDQVRAEGTMLEQPQRCGVRIGHAQRQSPGWHIKTSYQHDGMTISVNRSGCQ